MQFLKGDICVFAFLSREREPLEVDCRNITHKTSRMVDQREKVTSWNPLGNAKGKWLFPADVRVNHVITKPPLSAHYHKKIKNIRKILWKLTQALSKFRIKGKTSSVLSVKLQTRGNINPFGLSQRHLGGKTHISSQSFFVVGTALQLHMWVGCKDRLGMSTKPRHPACFTWKVKGHEKY